MNYKTTLVASPRCGGHWFVMITDLYFKNQKLSEFVFSEKNKRICNHTHDGRLKENYTDLIYLYREPVDKIYSEMKYYHKNKEYSQGERITYYNDDINNTKNIINQSERYADHLTKWLIKDKTKNKTVIYYDNLVNNFIDEFSKVCKHFGETIDVKKGNSIMGYGKNVTKGKTSHNKQIVNIDSNYDSEREEFRRKHSKLIYDTIFTRNKELKKIIK